MTDYENPAATVTEWTPDLAALSEECTSCRGTARGCDSRRLWQGDFCCRRCSHDEILVHHAPTKAPSRPPEPLSGAAARAALQLRTPPDTTTQVRRPGNLTPVADSGHPEDRGGSSMNNDDVELAQPGGRSTDFPKIWGRPAGTQWSEERAE